MKRQILVGLIMVLMAGLAPLEAEACEYKVKLFNHKQRQSKLRLYLEMTTSVAKAVTGKLKVKAFDTVHSLGDATVGDIGTYEKKGNGLSTVLMLDRSGSLPRKFQAKVRDAAHKYVDAKSDKDEIALYFFAENKHEYSFTTDKSTLKSTLNTEMPGKAPRCMDRHGNTTLYKHMMDAIDLAAKNGTRELRLLLVISDGGEEVHAYTPQQIIAKAKEKQVGIFAIGFRMKKNLKDLEQLKFIAESTGGIYKEADADDLLAPLFVYARKRADNFIVIDETMCGFTKEQARLGKYELQVAYEDCLSNKYPVNLDVLAKDPENCPQCKGSADCQGDEECHIKEKDAVGGTCRKLRCSTCQEGVDHTCQSKQCGSDADCSGLGDCECQNGVCGKTVIEICDKPWEEWRSESKQCEPMQCGDDEPCPSGTECKENGECGEKPEECNDPCQDKSDDGVCIYIECGTDCSCKEGCLCVDGSCTQSTQKGADKRPECKDGELPVGGECEALECESDVQCKPECGDGVLCSKACKENEAVCAPTVGLDEDDDERTCQPVLDGPCKECEEEIDGKCRIVKCNKDGDCAKGCSCDQDSGECLKKSIDMVWYIIGGLALLALLLLALAFKKKKGGGPLDDPVTTGQGGGGGHKATEMGDSQQQQQQQQQGPVVGTQLEQHHQGGQAHHNVQHHKQGTELDSRLGASEFALLVQSDSGTTRHPIPIGGATVGREPDYADIVIPHQIVSGEHMRIELSGGRIYVMVLGETNPTFYRGAQLRMNERTEVGINEALTIGASIKVIFEGPGGGKGGGPSKQATVIDY